MMKMITTLIGRLSEDKTDKLLDMYLYNNAINNKVYISCTLPVDEVINKLVKKTTILNMSKHNISTIKNEECLFNKMKTEILLSDCVFYIDDPMCVCVNFRKRLDIFIDSYPNKTCKHTCDVVYTRNKTNAFK